MNEQEWQAMRGFVDLTLGALILGRFLSRSSQLASSRARLAQFVVVSLLIAAMNLLGVWSMREIEEALKTLPVAWPLLAAVAFFAYRAYKYRRRAERAQFEIDWRREYQEVLLQELEQSGKQIPSPPLKNCLEDRNN